MPKNIVMLWVGDGKLAKSQGELPPGSLVYPDPRTQKGMCLDFESKTFFDAQRSCTQVQCQ